MRVAMLPMPTSRTFLLAESDLSMYRHAMATARELGIDVWADYVMFEDVEGQLPEGVNEKFFCVEKFANVYELQTQMPRGFVQLFHPVDGRYPVDAVITSRAILAPFLRRALWHRMHPVPAQPTFIWEGHAETSGGSQGVNEGCHNQVCDLELMMRSAGYAACKTFFSTERQKRGAIKEAARWLSTSACALIEKNSWVMPHPIRCDEIDETAKSTPKFDKFTVAFMGRYNATKNWSFVFETLRKYFSMGKPVDLVSVTPLHGANSDLGAWPEFTKYIDLPRKDYLKMLLQCHASLNASHEEGFCITVHEQLYAGQVVLLPRRDWVAAILGPHYETYPWLYTGKEEAIAKLEMVRANYPAARATLEPVRQYVRSKADAKSIVRFLFDRVGEAVAETKSQFTMSDKSVELVRRAAVAAGPMTRFSKICGLVREYAIQPGMIFNRMAPLSNFPGKGQVFWKLLELGWHDAGEADPIMTAPTSEGITPPLGKVTVPDMKEGEAHGT